MSSGGRDARSYLLTVKIWPEEIGEGRVEWRGKVHRVVSGETLYFRDWATMLAFLQETMEPLCRRQSRTNRSRAARGCALLHESRQSPIIISIASGYL
jgi:hypothetical protein